MRTLTKYFEGLFDVDDNSDILKDYIGNKLGDDSNNLKIENVKTKQMIITELKDGHSYLTDNVWPDIDKCKTLGINNILFKIWKIVAMSDNTAVDWRNIKMEIAGTLNLLYYNPTIQNMNIKVDTLNIYTKKRTIFRKSKINCDLVEVNMDNTDLFFDNSCDVNIKQLTVEYSPDALTTYKNYDKFTKILEDVHNGKKIRKSPAEMLGIGKINIEKNLLIKVDGYRNDLYYSFQKDTRNKTNIYYEVGNGWYFAESKANNNPYYRYSDEEDI